MEQKEKSKNNILQGENRISAPRLFILLFFSLVICLGILIIGFPFFSNISKQINGIDQPPMSPTPPIMVFAPQLIEDYASNEVAADGKYKNQLLEISGTVQSVSEDPLGNPYVMVSASIQTPNGVQGDFSQDQDGELSSLNPGQYITIECMGRGDVLGTVTATNCSIVQSSSTSQ